MAIDDTPIRAKGNANHATHLLERFSRLSSIPEAASHPSFLAHINAVTATSLRPRELLAPEIKPFATQKLSASKQSQNPARVAFGRSVPQSQPTASTGISTKRDSEVRLRCALWNRKSSAAFPSSNDPDAKFLRSRNLPSKPILRSTPNMNSRNRDARFPPLDSTSPYEVPKSAQPSPAAQSSLAMASLPPINQSGDPGASEVVASGTAHSSNDRPSNDRMPTLRGGVNKNYAAGHGSMRPQENSPGAFSANGYSSNGLGAEYALKTPGSPGQKNSEWSRRSRSITPSRPSRYSHLNQRPSLSIMNSSARRTTMRRLQPCHSPMKLPQSSTMKHVNLFKPPMNADETAGTDQQSISSTDTESNGQDPFAVPADTSLSMERTSVAITRDAEEPDIKSSIVGRTRKSKYGYSIRESEDARELLGGGEAQKSGNNQMQPRTTRFRPFGFKSSQTLCESPREALPTPAPKIPASYSSMSPRQATSHGGPDSLGASKPPRKGLFSRQTASSAARASAASKKDRKTGGLAPELTHFRPGSSLSNVSDGMKKLGRKVRNIIPGRRTAIGSPPSTSMVYHRIPDSVDDYNEPPQTPSVRANQEGHHGEAAEEVRGAVDELGHPSASVSILQAVSPNRLASVIATGDGHTGESTVDKASSSGGLQPATTSLLTNLLQDADLTSRRLMDRALMLEAGPVQTELVAAAQELGELVFTMREARIQAIRLDQEMVEMTVGAVTGAARLQARVEELVARQE